MNKITVLLVDDHKLYTEALTLILNSDNRFRVIGATADAEEAYRMIKEQSPRIVLLDINMIPVNGFEITSKIAVLSAVTKVIGLSVHASPNHAKKMIVAGAKGYVTKNSSSEELMSAILEVDKGNKYICREIKDLLAKEQPEKDPLFDGLKLTKIELAIVHAVRDGLSSKEIALKLSISIKTVEVHRYNILKKMRLKNTAELINYINKQGL